MKEGVRAQLGRLGGRMRDGGTLQVIGADATLAPY
jgi:hypothetical protein